jgi:hypothetical protein
MRLGPTAAPMLVLAGVLALAAGCERPAQPPQQHSELRRINAASTKPIPQVVDGSPLRFGEIGVSVVGPNNSTLGARADWQLTDLPEKVQEFFRSKVTTTRPELVEGQATGMALRCHYFDEGGVATGTDSLDIKIAQGSKGRVTFKNLGVGGRVSRIDVELEAIVWQSQDRETTVPVKRE